jgi:hypothetical protein
MVKEGLKMQRGKPISIKLGMEKATIFGDSDK